MEHPYKEYENTHTWDVVRQTITELVENNDIELQTPIEYVIGYIYRNLSSTENIGKSLEKNKLYENEEDCKIHTRNPTFRPSPCWGAKIKKHRNQLIYGALNDFLKAFVKSFVFVSAERQGFEPRVPRSTTVFKTAAIDHSATSPKLLFRSAPFRKRCKGTNFFYTSKHLRIFFQKKYFYAT